MKSSTTVLYPNQLVADRVTEYSEARTLALPKEIEEYHAWICETQANSNYSISTFQAKSIVWLARLIGAKHGKFKSSHVFVTICKKKKRKRGLFY